MGNRGAHGATRGVVQMQEFQLLNHVFGANERLPERVEVPPGDDMALVHLDGRSLLVAVDQVVEGRHFDRAAAPLESVGRKAIARSVSDIAAMAGRPVAALVAVTLPSEMDTDGARRLFDAMRDAAAEQGCPLIGGDVAVHAQPGDPLTCAVTVLAEPTGAGAVRRSGALAGDAVYVTGMLGGAWDGPAGHHLTFTPRVEAAIALRAALGDRLHAMIDVSDGAGRDGAHVARASGVRLVIDAAQLPRRRPELDWRRAMGDGEDYELLFTASGSVPASAAGVPVTRIGVVEPAGDGPAVLVRDGDQLVPADRIGWEHGDTAC